MDFMRQRSPEFKMQQPPSPMSRHGNVVQMGSPTSADANRSNAAGLPDEQTVSYPTLNFPPTVESLEAEAAIASPRAAAAAAAKKRAKSKRSHSSRGGRAGRRKVRGSTKKGGKHGTDDEADPLEWDPDLLKSLLM